MNKAKSNNLRKLIYIAIFTALVVVVQFIPIRFGPFELALSVPIIVIGAALLGPAAGTWLGFVFGAVVLALPGTAASLSFSLVGTLLTVLLKGTLAGLVAALIYRLLKNGNPYVACLVSAVAATLVNTGVFIAGSLIFFETGIAELFTLILLTNVVVELAVNIVLVPSVYRIVEIGAKKFKA